MSRNQHSHKEKMRGPQAFVVAIVAQENMQPIFANYRTRREALRSANGVRATLAPRQGGSITIYDGAGEVLQSWTESPDGGQFAYPGGFTNPPHNLAIVSDGSE